MLEGISSREALWAGSKRAIHSSLATHDPSAVTSMKTPTKPDLLEMERLDLRRPRPASRDDHGACHDDL
jgi:hypothetical protein